MIGDGSDHDVDDCDQISLGDMIIDHLLLKDFSTQGLDDLDARCKEYKRLGCQFAKVLFL